jgi:hypothetical protein
VEGTLATQSPPSAFGNLPIPPVPKLWLNIPLSTPDSAAAEDIKLGNVATCDTEEGHKYVDEEGCSL